MSDPVRRAEDGATTPNVERCALCYARRDPPEVSALIAKQKLVPRRFVKGATDALLCSYCVAECVELLKEPAESGPPPAEDGAWETEPYADQSLDLSEMGAAWSFLRSVLSQGADIWTDHETRSYAAFSARLDHAARTRADVLNAAIEAHVAGQAARHREAMAGRRGMVHEAVTEPFKMVTRVEQLEAEVARLRARVAELGAALAPFAFAKGAVNEAYLPDDEILELQRFNVPSYQRCSWYPSVRLGQIRTARAVLKGGPA